MNFVPASSHFNYFINSSDGDGVLTRGESGALVHNPVSTFAGKRRFIEPNAGMEFKKWDGNFEMRLSRPMWRLILRQFWTDGTIAIWQASSSPTRRYGTRFNENYWQDARSFVVQVRVTFSKTRKNQDHCV